MSLEESSKKSRIHFQNLPNILFHEKLGNRLIENLKKDRKLIYRKLGEIHSILLKKGSVEAFSDSIAFSTLSTSSQNAAFSSLFL